MGETYIDKRVGKNTEDKGSLKELVNKEFKRIEGKNGIGTRDDQEIRNAGWNVCNSIINEIKKDKTKVFGKRALEPLTNLIKELKKEYNAMTGMSLFTNNADKINQIANRIDNAENEALKRLQRNRATQDSRDIVRKSNETQKGKPMFVMEGGNDVTKQTGNIIFTEAANPVRIDQALKGLFQDPNIVYEIDYSGCDTSTPKGKAIKDKMTRLIGAQTCYLRYDEQQKTYTIRDKDGNGIVDRAYIWKGIKLIPAGIRKWNAYNEQKSIDNNLGHIDGSKINSYVAAMLKDMPSATELTEKQQVELFKKTEGRIVTLLREAKKLGYDLEPECISKKWTGSGLMELHLNSGSSEVDRTIWDDDKVIGSDLYDFLDGEENEYLMYLTKRVKQKRKELDSITKTETVNLTAKGNEAKVENQEKQQMLYGISLMEQMVENFRESEGDSWLDNDDERLVTIKKILRNGKVSIENSENIGKQAIINNIINPVWEEWKKVKNISRTIDNGQGVTYENPAYKQQYNQLQNVFFGSRDGQIAAIRNLGGHNRLFDKTETSFLQQEIEGNEDLTVKNTEVKKCLEKMKKCFPEKYDNEGKLILSEADIRGRDKMFNAAKNGTDNLIQLLVNSKMLPVNWKDEESEVRKCVENLKNQLNSISEQIENFSQTPESIKKEQHNERVRLEQKENKTENDIKALQALVYLENNPGMQNDINAKTIAETKIRLKYGNMGNLTKSCLFPALVELGDGAEGKNADIYNDITGYGFWNLSDENAKERSEEIIEEIIVEVAVTAVAIALSWNGAGEAIYAGFRVAKATAKGLKGLNKMRKSMGAFSKALAKNVATQYSGKITVRGAKAAKNLGKISHIATPARNGENIFKHVKNAIQFIRKEETLASVSGKLAMKGTSMVIEGTTFHLNSTIIHNAINGENLSKGLNPFGFTEGINGEKISNLRNYAESIAFLGVLKTISKPIQGLTGNMTKGILTQKYEASTLAKMFENGLSTVSSMAGEMGSMMGTDQILSVIFDQDFKPVSAEDLISMFGMVAGLRLTNKVNLKIQEYDKKSVSIEMTQGTDIYKVKIDRDGNVIKIEGKDVNGKKIDSPEIKLGIKSGVEGQNLRETHRGKEVGEIEGNSRELGNLHEGDVITVKNGDNEIKLRKNKDGNWEIIEDGSMQGQGFERGKEFIVKKNNEGEGYHLESKTEGGPEIALNEKVKIKLKGDEKKENQKNDKENQENEKKESEIERKLQEIQKQKEELTKKKESHEKRKPELEKKKEEIERRRAELLRLREENRRRLDVQENNIGRITEILQRTNVVTIDGLKYQFLKVKNGKAVFVIDKAAKLSAIKEKKSFSKKVEVSSLEELSDKSRFNLEPGTKDTNSGRYKKLQELLGEKVEPLDRLKNKIKNKQGEIATLQEEIARLEKGKNTIAHNDYFEGRKQEFVNKHIELWIDGVKYKASHLNDNGDIQFKEVDGNRKFTISSFKQLGKRVLGYNPYAKGYPSEKELANHNFIKDAIKKEGEELDARNIQETINQKKADLQKAEGELRGLQDKLPASQARQDAIDVRAKKGAEINKELGKLEVELGKVNEELSNTERLIEKYGNELASLEENETILRRDLDIDGNNLGMEGMSEGNELGEAITTREMLESEFETKIYSNEGVNINGDVYKLEFRNDPKLNKNRKGRIVLLKNGEELLSVNSETKDFPTGSNGDGIKGEYEKIKNKYLEQGLKEGEGDIIENGGIHTEEKEGHLDVAHEETYNDNNTLLLNGEIPEWGKVMKVTMEGEFYGNGALKKGTKSFINGLQLEKGEYDINGNIIKGEKYQYNAALYNVDSMPINGEKITTYIGHEYLVSKTGEINRNGEYKYPNKGTYNYKDGSEFVGEVDAELKPKEGKLIASDGKEYRGIFENGVLRKGYEMKLEGGKKIIKIVGEIAGVELKTQMETIGNEVNPGDRLEIQFPNGEKFTLKEENGRWIEEIKDKDGNYTNGYIIEKRKIGEYLEGKLKNKGNEKGTQQEQENGGKKEENIDNEKRKNPSENEIVEAIDITNSYQENIETRDGGRFTGELKDGEPYKGTFTDRNGNKWSIDKTSEHPVMREQDRVLLDEIGNKESVNVGELKRTHRTNFDALKQILDSGIIGNNGERGVQFWGGLGACYGEVALVMKNSVMDLSPAPANVEKGHGNYDYFFTGRGAKDRDWETFQREASDFSHNRNGQGENPNIDVPYLSIGGKNGTNGNFAHEVGIEHIEAVMLPAHAKKYPGYDEIVKRINEKGIKVIEVETEGNILDYAGGSVILAKDGNRGSFDKSIIRELAKRYPNIPTYEQQAVKYLLETGRLKEREIRGKTFEEIRQDYIKEATNNGFSRGGVRGGQYQNYSSRKNYTREQQAYFKYIVESRAEREAQDYPNPQVKYDVVEEAA